MLPMAALVHSCLSALQEGLPWLWVPRRLVCHQQDLDAGRTLRALMALVFSAAFRCHWQKLDVLCAANKTGHFTWPLARLDEGGTLRALMAAHRI